MEALAFLLAIIAMAIIILWARRNDTVPLDGETTGLLAMTKDATRKRKKAGGGTTGLPDGGPSP